MKSQIKKLISIFACVCLLLTAIIIPASAATTEIVFDFGENVATTTHADGTTIDPGKSYTNGDYTLTLTDTVKCYDGANDATGISALKMGTGSAVGSFTMTVPDDVTSVIFKVAKYKAKNTTVDINGTEYAIETSSNDGSYTAVTVDTTTTKTITFATVSGKTRCMIDSITYVIGGEAPVVIPEKTIAEVLAMEDSDDKFYVTAEIVDTYGSKWATYGNFILKDASTDETIIMYGLDDEAGNRYDAMETKPVVGDTVKVLANRSSYNGVGQLANAVLVEHTPAPQEKTIAEVLAMEDGDAEFIVTGEIVGTYGDSWATYGNLYIKDSSTDKQLLIYGLNDEAGNRYDAMETKPAVGDTIKVQATRSSYNGVAQLKNAVLLELTPAAPDEGGDEGDDTPVELPAPDETNTLTITEAIDLGASQETSAYTADKYYVTGQITAITSDMYGNMYLADEDGNEILVYGTYGADGNDRYDALESKPDAGDTVTVYGIVGNFNGTPQLKNAWIIEFTEGELDVETPAEPEADSVLTIPEAIELGLTKRSNEYTTNKYYVTGTITGFYGSQGETYGNIYIVDEEGNEFLIYGTWEVLDEIRYDAMETKPVVGDTVTVYGVIGQYNGTAQMKNGVFVDAPAADDGDDDTAGDTTTGGTTTGGTTTGGTTTGTTDNNTNTGVGTTTGTTSPDTGDNVGAFAVMAIAAAAVVLYTSKKRV